MGKLKSDDSACLILDNETDCNADNKCNWASGANLDDGTTWSAGGDRVSKRNTNKILGELHLPLE